MADAEHAGAAKRQRQRRLRQRLRHERMTVAMAVAEASSVSAPLRQKTATAICEVEAHESHEALRGQKELPPGARPSILADPGPQRSDRTVRCFAEESPDPRPACAGWSVSLLPHSPSAAGKEERGGGVQGA